MYSVRIIMFFGNIEACKSILVDSNITIMNIENEHNKSSLSPNLQFDHIPGTLHSSSLWTLN